MRTLLYLVVLWVAVLRPVLGPIASTAFDLVRLEAASMQIGLALVGNEPSPEQTHGCLGGHAHLGEDDSPASDEDVASSDVGQDDDFFVGAGRANGGPPTLGHSNPHDLPAVAARLVSARLDRPPRA